MSEGTLASASVEDVLLGNIPGAVKVVRANVDDDKSGVDWWVEVLSFGERKRVGVDAKVRNDDWASRGCDDLALETWSVVNESPGWTRDPRKRTDYVLWLWKDTGRWCLVPFAMLCAVFCDRWVDWRRRYQTNRQRTRPGPKFQRGWESECVFVPRKVVWRAIYERFGGDLAA